MQPDDSKMGQVDNAVERMRERLLELSLTRPPRIKYRRQRANIQNPFSCKIRSPKLNGLVVFRHWLT
jgi:hypothetical protein